MAVASEMVKVLLGNGVHFGHQASKWNPKMKKYIFGKKSGIYIIDLLKTEKALKNATDFLEKITREGKKVLFTGTKKQAKQIVKEEAERCGMFYVDERWLGGCLTNFSTIRKSIDRLDKLQKEKETEVYMQLAKKERVKIERDEQKLLKNFQGIRKMDKLPEAVVVVDSDNEKIAVQEAKKLGIPVIALLDTNCDPNEVDFPIPGNDDAIRAIRCICSALADAVLQGAAEHGGGKVEVKAPEKEAPKSKEKAPSANEEKEVQKEKVAGEKKTKAKKAVKKVDIEPEEKKEEADVSSDVSLEESIEGDISLG